jgi:hypothetical protein
MTVNMYKVSRCDILSHSEPNLIKLDTIDYQACIDNEGHFQISLRLNSLWCRIILYILTINKGSKKSDTILCNIKGNGLVKKNEWDGPYIIML